MVAKVEKVESRVDFQKKEELKWSTVALDEIIINDHRLEASVFNVEGRLARDILNRCKWPLTTICGNNGLATAFHKSRFKRSFVSKSNFPIYQPSQVSEIYPKPAAYISNRTKTNIDELRVQKNQILLTCSGTIGNCTIVSDTLDGLIFSHDLIRIDAKKIIDIGYMYAFLRSHIGKTLVNTNNYGAVVSHIEPEHLANVPIPNPSPILKKQIHDLVMNSFQLRDQSNMLIDEAQVLLKTSLKLPNIDAFKPNYFSKAELQNFSLSLSKIDNRFDASYHVPIVRAILQHLSKNAREVTKLGDSRFSSRILLPGRFKRVYVEEEHGIVFFGGKQILELDPSNKKYLSLKHHGRRITEQLSIKENTVLITRSGTIGKVNIAPTHWNGWIPNEHIIRIIPASNLVAGYLYAWLSSDYAYPLIKRFTYGAVVDEIDDNHVFNIEIPLLADIKIQMEINEKILKANTKRYEAYSLEQEAVKIMTEKVIYTQ